MGRSECDCICGNEAAEELILAMEQAGILEYKVDKWMEKPADRWVMTSIQDVQGKYYYIRKVS